MTATNEQRYRFTEAPIWELQRQYYEEQGTKAWRNDQVPQYITSNPIIANAYADMIFGFLQDRASRGHGEDPVTIVEIGAGAGRLAFHVLHELCRLRDFAGIPVPAFRYVMTDLPTSNIAAWQEHPALQRFIAEGLLDFARFDAVRDTELNLVVSGETIGEGASRQPLIVVANYFFCTIPQELLYIGDGRVHEADVFVDYPEHRETMTTTQLLGAISLRYEHRHAPEYERRTYPYRDLIAMYQEQLEDSHVLFPVAGLDCLERLNRLSREGFLLLTADKGDHLLDYWKFSEPPELVMHGSFSLTANYQAFQYHYESQGALALFPKQHYKNLNVGCIIHARRPAEYAQTRLAYLRSIERFGPDEFFSLKEWADKRIESMGIQQLLSFWRLGGYDAEFFAHAAKRISVLIPDANDEEKEDLLFGIERMWSSYYVMEQQRYDLALDAGLVLFEMDLYGPSKRMLEISVRRDPDDVVSTVYYCLAICCFELELEDEAWEYLRRLVELEPDHEEAKELLASRDA
ncbi:tetratricopeptide repeat protein [Cohnella sp. GCM10027633]|uniref:tetratricopeptide repeat protein n=1 Tax=unclassified Cohnella TaxID=2636738 RepID=UPI00363AABC6